MSLGELKRLPKVDVNIDNSLKINTLQLFFEELHQAWEDEEIQSWRRGSESVMSLFPPLDRKTVATMDRLLSLEVTCKTNWGSKSTLWWVLRPILFSLMPVFKHPGNTSALPLLLLGWCWCHWLWTAEELCYDRSRMWARRRGGCDRYGHDWKIQSQPAVPFPTLGCYGQFR